MSQSATAAALARLTHLHPKLIDLSLGRMTRLLAALGNPQDRLPPVIHVAGTNGKGSVVAFVRACLEAAGQRVHVFTSPHLVRFNERIRLAGAIIDDDRLVALLEEIEAHNAGQPITFFEATTAAALLAFSRETANAVILETGLGGRLDATNVIARPRVTVITPIAMDHESFLGNTLAAIAGEKAAIQKAGVASVIAVQAPEAERVLLAHATAVNAPLFHQDRQWSVRVAGDRLVYEGNVSHTLPLPALLGPHQIHNAGLAVAALEAGGFALPTAALAKGMTTVHWPARMQRLVQGPLIAMLPDGWQLWLDGGHNPAAGQALARLFAGWQEYPLDLIVGMMANKDVAGTLAPLKPYIARLQVVPVPVDPHQGTSSGCDPAAIVAVAHGLGMTDVAMAANPAAALRALVTQGAGSTRRVLIAGSLYLAGSVLRDNA